MDFNRKTILIIGLGLMGGSLAAACKRKFPRSRVIGVSRDKRALAWCKKKKWIDECSSDLKEPAGRADMIVLCTPVDTFERILTDLDRHAKRGALVTDVGSVKGEIQSWIEGGALSHLQFIGAHPMAGSHARGISAASPLLYDKSLTFIIRESSQNKRAYQTVKDFWKKISGRLVEVTAAKHDLIVAEISHLPHALAVCLMNSVGPKNISFAAGGFSDMTRIAQGHPSVWLPIFRSNRKAIKKTFEIFQSRFHEFAKALDDGDERKLETLLRQAGERRGQISV